MEVAARGREEAVPRSRWIALVALLGLTFALACDRRNSRRGGGGDDDDDDDDDDSALQDDDDDATADDDDDATAGDDDDDATGGVDYVGDLTGYIKGEINFSCDGTMTLSDSGDRTVDGVGSCNFDGFLPCEVAFEGAEPFDGEAELRASLTCDGGIIPAGTEVFGWIDGTQGSSVYGGLSYSSDGVYLGFDFYADAL